MVDDAPDPYGQPGCSGIWAYAETADPALLERLSIAAETATSITLKCATLEVDGIVGGFTRSGKKTRVEVDVKTIRIVPPAPRVERGLKGRDS